MSPFLGAVC